MQLLSLLILLSATLITRPWTLSKPFLSWGYRNKGLRGNCCGALKFIHVLSYMFIDFIFSLPLWMLTSIVRKYMILPVL